MYDTVTLTLPKELVELYDKDSHIQHSIRGPIKKWADKNVEYAGHIKNMALTKKFGNLYITGSLPKYRNGNNIQTIGISDVKFVIDDLSERLCLPLSEAFITRIDIGYNLPVKQPAYNYIHRINHVHSYPLMLRYDTNKTFIKTRKALLAYDKVKEMKVNQPDYNIEPLGNLLRIELQLDYPHRHLGITSSLKACALYKKPLARTLIAMWYKECCKVYKNRIPIMPPSITSQKEFSSFLLLMGIKQLGGENHLLEFISYLQLPRSKYPAKIKGDMKRLVETCSSNPRLAIQDDLDTELDQLIFRTAFFDSS